MKSKVEYYNPIEEPLLSTLLAINTIILGVDQRLNLQWKYQMPFNYFKNKMFCYSRLDKKTNQLYISFADKFRISHSALVSDGRKRFKLYYLNQDKDLQKKEIKLHFSKALVFHI